MHNLKNCFLAPALILSGLCVAQPDIDLVYGTFLGASGDETSFPNTLDKSADGHLGFMGSTSSPFMSTTPDAYQGQLQGLLNRFIVILDPEGAPVYRSYFGGGGETGGGFAFTENGGFVIGGFTNSASFPTTPGAHQTEFLEGEPGEPARMGTLSKFDENYQLEWSTYVGGDGLDIIHDVAVDSMGHIYAVGSTLSEDIALTGAHQETMGAVGEWAGFIAKFTPAGILMHLTYFQGDDFTEISKLQLSGVQDKLFVCGTTRASAGIAFGDIQDEFGGGSTDGFVARFESGNLNLEWSRYVGGANADGVVTMEVGNGDNLVLALLTTTLSGLATEGAHSEIPAIDSGDIFDGTNLMLMSLDSEGEIGWATYFGGVPPIPSITALSIQEGSILVAGVTHISSGISTENAFENELDPENGRFFSKFSLAEGNQEWGTYFGQNGQSFIYDIEHIDNGRFMAVGTGRNPNGYITDDAYQSVFGGGARDFYYAIFEENTLSTHETALQPLELYPNPTGHAVRVTAPGNLFGTVALQVYDLSGRMVLQQAAFHSGTELRVGHLPAGIYVVHVQDHENHYRQKLVVAK